MRYIVGKALPGGRIRAKSVDWEALEELAGTSLFHGTFNVRLKDEADLGKPDLESEQFALHRCEINTAERITDNQPSLAGWVVIFKNEPPIPRFVEVVASSYLRTLLSKRDFPDFPVEIGLR